IPAFIEVSLSNLGVNQAIKVSELQNDDYEILTQGNVSIVTVTAKGKVEEETPGQGGKK
ncbi:hypothetical protein EBR96_10425, partial [bacterium]|nr:hypothetical protein [bacterium]